MQLHENEYEYEEKGAMFDVIFQYVIVSDSAPRTHLIEYKRNLLRNNNFMILTETLEVLKQFSLK